MITDLARGFAAGGVSGPADTPVQTLSCVGVFAFARLAPREVFAWPASCLTGPLGHRVVDSGFPVSGYNKRRIHKGLRHDG